MTAENQDFTMWAGDYKALRFLVTGIAAPADVLAADFKMSRCDENAAYSIAKTLAGAGIAVTQAVGGVYVTVTLLPTDTETALGVQYVGYYKHELEVTDAAGHPDTVATGHATVRSALT